jgi:capsular polysaccharide export protein
MGAGVPVIALGRAVYTLPGMTFQGDLDDFWLEATPADPALFDAFRRVVVERTQINGGFYSKRAVALAVEGAARRLERYAPQAPAVQPAPRTLEREFGLADVLRPLPQ